MLQKSTDSHLVFYRQRGMSCNCLRCALHYKNDKEEKQVTLPLAVTTRSCRGSLCYGTVHGHVALTCSRSAWAQDSHSQCGRTLVCDVHVLAFCGSATAFWPSLEEFTALRTRTLFNSECHWSCLSDRCSHPHSSASSPKSLLGSSHQSSVLALASIVFHLPGRKIMSDTHTGQSSKGSPRLASCPNSPTSDGTYVT